MGKIWKKITMVIMTFVLAAGCMFIPVQTVQAASKPAMEKAKVSWDLAPNKKVTYLSYYAGLGLTKQKVQITDYMITDADEEGYKVCSFKITFTLKWNMTKAQADKILFDCIKRNTTNIGGDFSCMIVDYNTGKQVGLPNSRPDIKIEAGEWVASKVKKYPTSHGPTINLASTVSRDIEVTYPEDCKGLCIGATGSTKLKNTSADKKFWKGKTTFDKTSFYSKKNKKVAHFMRIN